mmetsp:Transcript_112858/g.224582  ORF Transcript_112858/g.224582 Transcript_112858/m.224582 type:complete len:801 (+) Transcript_112858:72-2474(+)
MVPTESTQRSSEAVGSTTQAATLACDDQTQHVEGRLKKLLLEQTQENGRLVQALRTRDTERWQLLQLLQHKDEQLRAARESSLQTRVSLQPAQKTVSRYLAWCVFHAWFDHTRRSQGRRRLLQAKNKFIAVVVRRACACLCANLQQATNRQTRDALHGLWLHVAGEHLGGRLHTKQNKLSLVEEAARARFSLGHGKIPLVPQTEDMLVATPRSGGVGCYLASSLVLPRGCPSPTSEASTSVPPSTSPLAARATDSSKTSCHWMGHNPASAAAARLASTVEASHAQCLSWAVRKWHAHHNPCLFPLPPVPALPSKGRSTCCNRTNQHEQENACQEAEKQALYRKKDAANFQTAQRADGRDISASEKMQAESLCWKLCERLPDQDFQVFNNAPYNADDATATSQSRKVELLETCHSTECNALQEERGRSQDLQMEIQVLQELAEHDAAEARASEEVLEVESRKLENAEVLQATLESRLAQEVNWRSEAEQRIISMVSCGEALEHERAQLLSLQSGLQEAAQVARQALEAEEQVNERMRLRTRAFEEENSQLLTQSRHERQIRLEQASSQDDALVLARRDVVSLHAASDGDLKRKTGMILEESYKAEAAATHALCEAWADEQEGTKRNHDRIRTLTKMLCQESGAVRWREQVEAKKIEAYQARVLNASSVWQEHQKLHAAYKQAQVEAVTEVEACEYTKAALEECFARVNHLQEELTSFEKSLSPASSSSLTTGLAVNATPQLDELDSYAQLVARLHAEIRWERAEHEAADSSLSSLRSSYRLLLQRVECPGHVRAQTERCNA